mmetsp:Transcript_9761/g.59311  ORF Transcript_9761/g.59311 Transcript_9761/m.59311 type:complete len:703 (-) Transcript_9761:2437-4545(-)
MWFQAFALPALQIAHESLKRGRNTPETKVEDICWRMSDTDRDPILAVDHAGTRCQARSPQSWGGGRAAAGVRSGKCYFEVRVEDPGLCRVGWASLSSVLDLGTDRFSYGYGGTGKKSHERKFVNYGEAYGQGDTIGCLLDLENRTVSFTKNGCDLGVAFELGEKSAGFTWFPAICLKNAEITINFGSTPSQVGPPQGYNFVANLPSLCVAAPAGDSSEGASSEGPVILVLEPARDLAEQTNKFIGDFAKYLSSPAIRHLLLVGGEDGKKQAKAIQKGAEVITGTPLRVLDFLETNRLSLNCVRFLVLDEADRLLDKGNQDTIMKIFQRIPKLGTGIDRLQVLLFSATLHSSNIKECSEKLCQQPVWVDLKGKDAIPDTVHHAMVQVDPKVDRTWLQSTPEVWTDGCHTFDSLSPDVSSAEGWSEALKILKPRILKRLIDTHNMSQCMVFCRTNYDCDNLERFLNTCGGSGPYKGRRETGVENPYSCVVLGGARSMEERRRNLQAFKEGEVRFLLCTDVAARGLDVKELPYVINMTLPDEPEDYVHRIGRVGRAECMGLAISLVGTEPEKVWYCRIKGYKPWLKPGKKDVATLEKGGHTTWHHETLLIRDIEKRIGQNIPTLSDDLSLPKEFGSFGESDTVIYGQARGGGFSKEAAQRVAELRPTVSSLAELEIQAQHSFLSLKACWSQQTPEQGQKGRGQVW